MSSNKALDSFRTLPQMEPWSNDVSLNRTLHFYYPGYTSASNIAWVKGGV